MDESPHFSELLQCLNAEIVRFLIVEAHAPEFAANSQFRDVRRQARMAANETLP